MAESVQRKMSEDLTFEENQRELGLERPLNLRAKTMQS